MIEKNGKLKKGMRILYRMYEDKEKKIL